VLVAFCGIDGAGKTTFLEYAHKWCEENSLGVQAFRPLRPKSDFMNLLNDTVDKYEKELSQKFPLKYRAVLQAFEVLQQNSVIEKWLDEGSVVLLDRWIYSHYAYSSAYDSGSEVMEFILEKCIKPDIIFLFDLPVEEALKRIEKRGKMRGRNEKHTILTAARKEFLRRSTEDNFVIIDTVNNSYDEICEIIAKELSEKSFLKG